MATNNAIKFPKQHYVGFQARPSVDEVPLGFMTPEGTDQAATKRKATVDSWASGSYYGNNKQKKLPAQTFDNTPLIGFKLGRSIRHGGSGWGAGNVKWRIEDPRGFELEISSPNFAQIISFCNLEKGEIQEECVWARLGNENILVPVNSDVYDNTVRNTERMSKKASMRDVKIGDTAIMHNGDEGVYYGAMYVIKTGTDYNSHGQRSGEIGKVLRSTGKKRHVFLLQQPGSDGVSSVKFFRAMSSPKVSEKFDAEETWTLEESEAKINKMVREDGIRLDEASTDYGTEEAVSLKPYDNSDFTQTEETIDVDAQVEWTKANNPSYMTSKNSGHYSHHNYYVANDVKGQTFFTAADGKWLMVDLRSLLDTREKPSSGQAAHQKHPHNKNVGYYEVTCTVMDRDAFIATGSMKPVQEAKSRSNGYYGYGHSTYMENMVVNVDVSDIPNTLYRVKRSLTTDQGTEIAYYR